MALMLSQHKTGQVEIDAPSSDKREHNHLTFVAVLARALYSASILDQATVACFLQPQEIRLTSKNTKITNGVTIITIASPICLQEGLKRMSVRAIYLKTKTNGLF